MPKPPEGAAALVDNRVLNPTPPRRGRNPLISAENAVRAGLTTVAVLASAISSYGAVKEARDPGSVSAPIAGAVKNAGEAVANLVNGPTEEQKIAHDLLQNAPENRVLTNLVVSGDAGANMRRKPATSASIEPDGVAGEVRGRLKPGEVIDRAIVVMGTDPKKPMDSKSRSPWYAFENSKTGDIVFSWSGNFQVDKVKAASITPFELKNH